VTLHRSSGCSPPGWPHRILWSWTWPSIPCHETGLSLCDISLLPVRHGFYAALNQGSVCILSLF
jgi:hypothetical protein